MVERAPPLNWQIQITDKDGRPTPEFQRLWQAQMVVNGTIPALSTPAAVSAVLDVLGTTRGAVLVRGASGWVLLPPGASGAVLTAHGAGADPDYQLPDGISDLLDGLGSVRGSVLYRGASGWAALGPGMAGQVFSTNGAGADPSWTTPSGGTAGIYWPVFSGFTFNTTAAAAKGTYFRPAAAINVAALRFIVNNTTAGSTYKAVIFEVGGGSNTTLGTQVGNSSGVTVVATGNQDVRVPLSATATLSSGTLYWLAIVITSGANNTSVNLLGSTTNNAVYPGLSALTAGVVNSIYSIVATGYVISNAPATGNTLSSTSNTQPYGIGIETP